MTFFFTDKNKTITSPDDKNYDKNILIFSSTNKNETKMLGWDEMS